MRRSFVFGTLIGEAFSQTTPTPVRPDQPTKLISAADLVDLPSCAVSFPDSLEVFADLSIYV